MQLLTLQPDATDFCIFGELAPLLHLRRLEFRAGLPELDIVANGEGCAAATLCQRRNSFARAQRVGGVRLHCVPASLVLIRSSVTARVRVR